MGKFDLHHQEFNLENVRSRYDLAEKFDPSWETSHAEKGRGKASASSVRVVMHCKFGPTTSGKNSVSKMPPLKISDKNSVNKMPPMPPK